MNVGEYSVPFSKDNFSDAHLPDSKVKDELNISVINYYEVLIISYIWIMNYFSQYKIYIIMY